MARWAVTLALAVVAVLSSWLWREPPDLHEVFRSLDKDGNSLLTLEEFLAMRDASQVSTSEDVLDVHCYFTPLRLDSMDRDLAESSITMRGLLEWTLPARTEMKISRQELAALVPPEGMGIGETWYMVEPLRDDQDGEGTRYRDMKYFVPAPPDESASYTLHTLLSMFHRNVFIQTRFLPRGTVATIRAKNLELLDIVFRCHAEFQLNSPPLLPFWFTPAQFQGRLIISRDSSKVLLLSLSVPTTRKLNVDMEWINRLNDNMEVDIGFLPLMELNATGIKYDLQNITWEVEIQLKNAYNILERTMLPFKEDLAAQGDAVARRMLDKYQFPVMSQLLDPSGSVLTTLNANDILDEKLPENWWNGYLDPMEFVYMKFLKQALSV